MWTPIFLGLLALRATWAFQFQTNVSASLVPQCGWVEVDWMGGTPPFSIVFIPSHGIPVNITLESTDYDLDTRRGTAVVQMPFSNATPFVVAMSDATGIGTGGISEIYTAISGDSTCMTNPGSIAFTFYLNTISLFQCQRMNITWDATVEYPVTILAMVPGGQLLALVAGGPGPMYWNAAVPSGTQVFFAAFGDSGTQIGGSSAFYTVQSEGDASCLAGYQLTSTPVVALPTGQDTASSTTQTGPAIITITATPSTKPGSRLTAGDLAVIVVACLASFAIFQAAIVWFCCRRQLKAFLLHRKELRARRVRSGGDVNMLTTRGGSEAEDDVTSQMATTGDVPRPHLWTGSSRGAPSISGYTQAEDDQPISPFEDSPVHSFPNYHSRNPFATPLDEQGTFSSSGSRDAGYSNTDFRPASDSSPGSLPFEQTWNGTGSSSSKAALVAALASSVSSGTDQRSRTSRPSLPDSDRRDSHAFELDAPQRAPAGGFRRHEDAGHAPEEDVEDLPPLYKPEWESEGGRRERRRSEDRN